MSKEEQRRQELKKSHESEAIRKRLAAPQQHSYLRDFIYGSVDGTVTTFAVVSGVAGAGLSPGIVIVLGLANLVGDGFSMAAGNYLGTRAQEQQLAEARRSEKEHITIYPEGEREEIRQIFAAKGFQGEELESAVRVITSDVEQWVNTMITDELGLPLQGPDAFRAAATTFLAFLLVGMIPVLPFLLDALGIALPVEPYRTSSVTTAMAFFSVGAIKARYTKQSWWRSGLSTLAIGGSAAGLAYCVGMLLRGFVQI